MFCSNCGQKLSDEAKFCPNCGTPVRALTTPVTSVPETDLQPDIQASEPVLPVEPVPSADSVSVEEPVLYADTLPVAEPVFNVAPVANTAPEEFPVSAQDENPIELPLDLPVELPEEFLDEPVQTPEYAVPVAQVPFEYQQNVNEPAYIQQSAAVTPPTYAQPIQSAAIQPGVIQAGMNPPVVKETKKKKSALPLIIALLAIAALVGGYFYYQSTPAVRFKKTMERAQEAYQSEDYQSASALFEEALLLQPDDYNAQLYLYDCLDIQAEKRYDAGDYEGAIRLYEEASVKCPDFASETKDYISAIYADWAYDRINDDDLDTAQTIIDKGTAAGYDLSEPQNDLNHYHEYMNLMDEMNKFMQQITLLLDNDDFLGAVQSLNDNAPPLIDRYKSYGGTLPAIFDVNGKSYSTIGLYEVDGIPAAYYGQYDGESREGTGDLVMYLPTSSSRWVAYRASCQWQNDIPNGSAVEYICPVYFDEIQNDRHIYSTVVNGLYDGPVQWEYPDLGVFNGSFTLGHADVIDTIDPNGKESNVIAYNEDKSTWIYRDDSDLLEAEGIYGYGD